MPPLQTRLAQSAGAAHGFPALHPAQLPPQSVAVSEPFFAPSVQVAVWHFPPRHTDEAQSVPAPQSLAAGQRAQVPVPPQSTSDSPPFLKPSVHVAAVQCPFWHVPLLQSAAPPHILPAAQGGHTPPPQSASDSPPFFAPSLHVGEAHTRFGGGAQ